MDNCNLMKTKHELELADVKAIAAAAEAEALKNSTWVGDKFADETRKMHYGERDEALIHGQATLAEAKALVLDAVRKALDGLLGFIRRHEVEIRLHFRSGKVGDPALIDLVRASDDPALGGLAKYLRQAHHRHRAGSDDVGQNLTRADRGQLVDVTDDQDGGVMQRPLCLRSGRFCVDLFTDFGQKGLGLEAEDKG